MQIIKRHVRNSCNLCILKTKQIIISNSLTFQYFSMLTMSRFSLSNASFTLYDRSGCNDNLSCLQYKTIKYFHFVLVYHEQFGCNETTKWFIRFSASPIKFSYLMHRKCIHTRCNLGILNVFESRRKPSYVELGRI